MSGDVVRLLISQVPVIRGRVNTTLEGIRKEVRSDIHLGKELFENGVSRIDQTRENWTLKPPATISDLHSIFEQAYKHMESARTHLKEYKTKLETCSKDMAQLSGDMSRELQETKEDLAETKSNLASLREDVEEKSKELKELKKDLREMKEELEATRDKHESTSKTRDALGYATIPLLILCPFVALGTGIASASLTGVLAELDNDVSGLENKVESSQSEYSLVSDMLDEMKLDESLLVSDKAYMTGNMKVLREADEKLRRLIEKLAVLLQKIRPCCTVLGVIVNKFESLKEESDPASCINLSSLKIPIAELESKMQNDLAIEKLENLTRKY